MTSPDPLKLIVAGSRSIVSQDVVSDSLDRWLAKTRRWPSEVVHGDCYGVDRKADNWAAVHGIKRTPCPYPSHMGKSGGPARNRVMGDYGDELLAIWDGVSRGTFNMITIMRGLKKPVTVIQLMRNGALIIAPEPE